jgi:O-antigen/teichoic acid export membrane protein
MTHPRQLVRDSLGVALTSYLARAVVLARGVVAAAVLGPRGYGGWNALNLVLDYSADAPAGALQGLDLTLPPALAGAPPGATPAPAWALLGGAWWAVLVGGGLFTAAVGLAAATGHPAMARDLGVAPLALVLASGLLQLAIQVHASALRARGAFGVVNRAGALQVLVGGGLGIALVARYGLTGLLAAWLAGTLLALALVRRAAPVPLTPATPAVGLGLVRAGFPVFAFFAASLVLRSVDRLALIRHGDAATLGHYSVGLLAAGLVLYLPEAAASVLYPRIAAAHGAGTGGERVRLEVTLAQRALAVTLPLAVALALPWAAPLTARWLPAFAPGLPALTVLAIGALLLAAATLPGYFLLATGRGMRLLALGAGAAALNAALVFGVAARAPRPTPVAIAAAVGYGVFGLGLVTLAARELFAAAAARRDFLIASFVPALWAAALVLGAAAWVRAGGWAGALARSAIAGVGYLPVLWWLGRGVGLRRLAREWLAPRPGST